MDPSLQQSPNPTSLAVAIWVSQYWSTRVVACGQDEHHLGRWCWVTIGSPDGTLINIVCVYRVCQQKVRTAGALTATWQQFDSLEMNRGATKSVFLACPRTQTPKDLDPFLQQKQAEGHLLIVTSDTNETPSEATFHDGDARPGTMEAVFRSRSLQDIFTRDSRTPPSTSTNKAGWYIDPIVVSVGIPVVAAGILPIYMTKVSDHSPMFLDIDGATLLGGKGSPLMQLSARRLSVRNEQTVTKYLDHAFHHAAYHNIE